MNNEPKSLIHRQRGLLACLGVLLLLAGCGSLAPGWVSTLFNVPRTAVMLVAPLAVVSVLAVGLLTVRCPQCGLRLLWRAMRTQPAGAWLAWLLRLKKCPGCGHVHE